MNAKGQLSDGSWRNAVVQRVREHKAEIKSAYQCITSGQRLSVEKDESRKFRRLRAIMGGGENEARKLVNQGAKILPRQPGREARQGDRWEFQGVAFLEAAAAAALPVARVATAQGMYQGSGFMVSDRLFLTNQHVLKDATAAGQFVLEFNYQTNHLGVPRDASRFKIDAGAFYLSSAENDLDFALVAVGERISGPDDLDHFGFLPLSAKDDKHMLGEWVNIIQHPDGNYKQVVLRQNDLVLRIGRVLHYVADTSNGSSGSPVFNDQWQVVALHHYGLPFLEVMNNSGQRLDQNVNEGVRISAILSRLASMVPGLTPARQLMLQRVMEPGMEFPSKLSSGVAGESARHPRQGRPVVTQNGNSISVRIPLPELEIALRMPGSEDSAPPSSTPDLLSLPTSSQNAFGAESVEPELPYTNRMGYDPAFLPGIHVPLPLLSRSMDRKTARIKEPPEDADAREIKYTHFSIMLNSKRRFAWFAACNIDGSTWVDIDRESGQPREAAEAREKWFDDERIEPDEVTNQSLYDNQTRNGQSFRVFDRGHLVRRQDPTWGTSKRAVRANADTFHFTNCVPQASTFNQRSAHWQGVEQYVLEDNAVADGERISVFTGPVLADDDPHWRGVQIPRRFWKIIVRVDHGVTLAIALMADQSDFIKELPDEHAESAAEAWDDVTKVRTFLSTVAEIEAATALDFGSLRDHDVTPGPEARRRAIQSFSDIQLRPRKEARPKRSVPASGKSRPSQRKKR
jgi:endonuclease G, mitochondrial